MHEYFIANSLRIQNDMFIQCQKWAGDLFQNVGINTSYRYFFDFDFFFQKQMLLLRW